MPDLGAKLGPKWHKNLANLKIFFQKWLTYNLNTGPFYLKPPLFSLLAF
jgi:hypothetical protein